jgi:hypothetical protein
MSFIFRWPWLPDGSCIANEASSERRGSGYRRLTELDSRRVSYAGKVQLLNLQGFQSALFLQWEWGQK